MAATEEVFVATDEGIWIAADTVRVHTGGVGGPTVSTLCKLYVTPGRIFFDAGAFRDLTELARNEIALPLEDPMRTGQKVMILLLGNHQDISDPQNQGNGAGFVQVRNGSFEAQLIDLNSNLVDHNWRPVYLTMKGVPHGFGINVDERREEAAHDPRIAARFMAHPKAELLTMLDAASKVADSGVGPPFSVMLLRADGSIQDRSDNSICKNEHGLAI